MGKRQRGRLTSLPERLQLVERVNHAVASGARKAIACAEIGLSLRSLQRWSLPLVVQADVRTTTLRPQPPNALSEQERCAILAICNSPEFASLPPSQIVPRLADQGRYLASEATYYRILKAADQQHAPHKHATLTTHSATAANKVWSRDITYLASKVCGQYY
jgi:putative transposase